MGSRGGEGLETTHLLFAYVALIFCDTSQEYLEYLSWSFMWFEVISKLKINLKKSELILIKRS